MSAVVEAPVLLSIKQAARMLSATPWELYQLVDDGRIPHGRIGRRIVLHRDDVLAFAREVTA